MKSIRLVLLTVLFLLASMPAWEQNALQRSEIGFNMGGMNYLGDLNDQSMLGKMNMAWGIQYRYTFDNRWSMRFDYAQGHVEGGNPDAIAWRNLNFRSPIHEVSMRAEFTFVPFGLDGVSYKWTPYIFGGLGLFHFNPMTQYTDPLTGETQWYNLQPLGTEGQGTMEYLDRSPYSLNELMLPFGLGFRFKPSKLFCFSIEYGFRKTWTDYLDDCSLTYVGSELLNQYHPGGVSAALADRSETANLPGVMRGDDSLDDWYAYLNFSVTLRLDKMLWWVGKKKCDPER